MQFHSKGPTTAGRHPARRPNPADRPPSTAWLAAQEAFSAPRPTAANSPVVVVRRASAQDLMESTGISADGPKPVAAARPARVFRVVGGTAMKADPQSTSPATDTAPPPLETVPVKRNRRASPDRRPGPVKLIVQASSTPSDSPVASPAPGKSHGEQLHVLKTMMASLDAMLSEIMTARRIRILP